MCRNARVSRDFVRVIPSAVIVSQPSAKVMTVMIIYFRFLQTF